MYMQCRHIKPNGLPCKSPALKGGDFCFYHSKIHINRADPDAKYANLELPTPEDPAAIQLSIARINDAILNGRLDLKKAATLHAGLKIASRFINPKSLFFETGTVQASEHTTNGDELAPKEYVCDDDEQCDDCPYSEVCPRCIHPDDDDEDE
jgi:hypothetical protein